MEAITNISQLDFSKQYTYADYLTWWFDDRVELIRGYIRKMSPAPSRIHQRISGLLYKQFAILLEDKICEAYYAPFDVRLTKSANDREVTTVVQPDLCVVCDPALLDDRGCNGAPTLIIEILLLKNSKHDVDTKFNIYQDAGVAEYWIVAPSEKTVNVFVLENDAYKLIKIYAEDDIIPINSLSGMNIQLAQIFNY